MTSNADRNEHLNLFQFYGDGNKEYYENNLTRGLALCLENDPILLDRFLREILTEERENLFTTEEILIDVQNRTSQLTNVNRLIGIAMTADELPEESPENSIDTDDPRTDLTIQIDETLIIVEVKRNEVDCRAQLINQMQRVAQYNELEIHNYDPKNYSWKDVMKLMRHSIKFQKTVNNVNRFTNDFYQFIKRKHPVWMGPIKLNEISFPKTTDSNNLEFIEIRLNFLKQKILDKWNKEKGLEKELVYDRANIPVTEFGWVDEINIEPETYDGKNYIAVKIWPGDTKTQGYSIFRNDKPFNWPEIISGANIKVNPYLKFAHRQGLCWIFLNDKTNPQTHKKDFFYKYTGKWTREEIGSVWEHKGAKWSDFDNILENVSREGVEWKVSSGWKEKIQDSNRSYFNVSTGFAISALIDYKEAQGLDAGSSDNFYPLADKLKEVSENLLKELDREFSG